MQDNILLPQINAQTVKGKRMYDQELVKSEIKLLPNTEVGRIKRYSEKERIS